jgi:hypothetical protein
VADAAASRHCLDVEPMVQRQPRKVTERDIGGLDQQRLACLIQI